MHGYQRSPFPHRWGSLYAPAYHPLYSRLNSRKTTANIYRSLSFPQTPLYTNSHPNAKPHVMSRALQSHHFYAQQTPLKKKPIPENSAYPKKIKQIPRCCRRAKTVCRYAFRSFQMLAPCTSLIVSCVCPRDKNAPRCKKPMFPSRPDQSLCRPVFLTPNPKPRMKENKMSLRPCVGFLRYITCVYPCQVQSVVMVMALALMLVPRS
jgi:hypothetical protein